MRDELSVSYILLFLILGSTPPYSRNAMDNASKNAGDMIGALQLQYNRGRQASITNELVDIITGKLNESDIWGGFLIPRFRCQCVVKLKYICMQG